MPTPFTTLARRLKALADPTRLRILALLARGEMSVSDLTFVLGQSQPRVSRHLKLLAEAGLVDRFAEGVWAYFHLVRGEGTAPLRPVLNALPANDPTLSADTERLEALNGEKIKKARAYFDTVATVQGGMCGAHGAEAEVDAMLCALIGEEDTTHLVDLGCGAGALLLAARAHCREMTGIDDNPAMLELARARLRALASGNAQVHRGNVLELSAFAGDFDCAVLKQVLHFLPEPGRAIAEAARVLRPGGRLLIADLAPHRLESLRNDHAHIWLGFSPERLAQWGAAAGLQSEAVRTLPPAPTAAAESLEGLSVLVCVFRKPRTSPAQPERTIDYAL